MGRNNLSREEEEILHKELGVVDAWRKVLDAALRGPAGTRIALRIFRKTMPAQFEALAQAVGEVRNGN